MGAEPWRLTRRAPAFNIARLQKSINHYGQSIMRTFIANCHPVAPVVLPVPHS